MIQGQTRSWSTYLASLVLASSLVACIQEAPKKVLNTTPDDQAQTEDPETTVDSLEPETNMESGAFGKPSGSSSGNLAPKKFCTGALAAGDLAVVELMISSKPGSGDSGEWVEIQSTRDCWLKVGGVTVESPRGTTASDSASLEADYELAPGGTFLVANSLDASKNNALPGKVISWEATDVLKNSDDTIVVKLGELEIDRVAYSGLTLTAGTSIAFPRECGDHADFKKWVGSSDSYGETLKGTPNAINDDVNCPQ